EALDRFHRALQPVLVVLELGAWRDPPVQVRRKRDVAELRQPLGGALDVAAHAEDLHQHDEPSALARRREREMGAHLGAVGRLNRGRRHAIYAAAAAAAAGSSTRRGSSVSRAITRRW